MLRIPHCVDSPLTDGGKVVSITTGRTLLPTNSLSASGIHFCLRLSKPQCLARLEDLDKLKKCIHLIVSRTRDLPACTILPHSIPNCRNVGMFPYALCQHSYCQRVLRLLIVGCDSVYSGRQIREFQSNLILLS
jgi:hypothetical protein